MQKKIYITFSVLAFLFYIFTAVFVHGLLEGGLNPLSDDLIFPLITILAISIVMILWGIILFYRARKRDEKTAGLTAGIFLSTSWIILYPIIILIIY